MSLGAILIVFVATSLITALAFIVGFALGRQSMGEQVARELLLPLLELEADELQRRAEALLRKAGAWN